MFVLRSFLFAVPNFYRTAIQKMLGTQSVPPPRKYYTDYFSTYIEQNLLLIIEFYFLPKERHKF